MLRLQLYFLGILSMPMQTSAFYLQTLQSPPIKIRDCRRCMQNADLRIPRNNPHMSTNRRREVVGINQLYSTLDSELINITVVSDDVDDQEMINSTTSNATTETDTVDEDIEPICRVVATSDGKISPQRAISSLSPSSTSLLEKVELLYTVQSQKELRHLTYTNPSNEDELSFDSIEEISQDENNGKTPTEVVHHDLEQEEKLVSILKQSLEDGGFKLMNQRDLDLCSALNAGYLLRLSLLPDVKELDPSIGKEFYPELYDKNDTNSNNNLLFGGRALVFRRGYSQEITTGRLLLPKLDYLQASLVQRSSTALTRKFGMLEQKFEEFVLNLIFRLNSAIERSYRQAIQKCRDFTTDMVENFGLAENKFVAGLTQSIDSHVNTTFAEENGNVSSSKTSTSTSTYNIRGNRIFNFARYQTSTSTIIPTSLDLNDALTPFLLCEVGENNTSSSVEQDIYDGIKDGTILCQYDDAVQAIINDASLEDRPSLESTYKPAAVRLLERTSIQNTVDLFSKIGRRELIRNYFKSSTLVEPAYEEVIVIWRPMRKKKPKQLYPPKWLYKVAEVFDMEDRLPKRENNTNRLDHVPMPLEIKAFSDVPLGNIEAVLPKNKLVFRPADAIVFDLVSVVSFLAIAGSLKFDSPKLDLIALVSLVFFAVRTFFRYSNKYARYDLLVNKFLTSKLSHRGAGK